MKVLLLSPCAGIDPAGGDVTYTQILLSNPPAGVEYESYDRALERGALRERAKPRELKARLRKRHWGESAREVALAVTSKSVNLARRHGLLFREPFRWFEVEPGEFDLIHMHIFSARFVGEHPPLVVSNGGPLEHLYRHAHGWSERNIQRAARLEKRIARALGADSNSHHLASARRLITYSQSGRDEFVRAGLMPRERIEVIPTFLSSEAPRARSFAASGAPVVGFIARDFKHKGGPTLLEAWPRVRAQHPSARLIIAGNQPLLSAEEAARQGIEWHPYLPREHVLNELLPSLDVFVYATTYDYLPCFGILEAMARGIPLVLSDHGWMNEVADEGRAGLIAPVGDASALASGIVRLLDPVENQRFGEAARAHFEARYSTSVNLPRLLDCYHSALETSSGQHQNSSLATATADADGH